MITKLLNEVNEKIETLNNLVQDKEYFEKLDERIEKVNDYVQEQKQEIERLNNIIEKNKYSADELNEIERLENIIKEVREYIKEHIRIDDEYPAYMEMLLEEYKELLEILDKVD